MSTLQSKIFQETFLFVVVFVVLLLILLLHLFFLLAFSSSSLDVQLLFYFLVDVTLVRYFDRWNMQSYTSKEIDQGCDPIKN